MMTGRERKIRARKPRWLMRSLPKAPEYGEVRNLIRKGNLHTVCQEARCPNQFECYSGKTATFLIMGPKCTRNCRFCSVESGTIPPPKADEPQRVAMAAKEMGLRYVVVTSVTRDDLADGGASFFAETITAIKKEIPGAKVEVLTPDFLGNAVALETVLKAGPAVFNHNVETVPRLYESVRPEAIYERSLNVLKTAGKSFPEIPVKSGLMVGLGETDKELADTLADIKNTGCSLLTIGQYLQPSEKHFPVSRYVTPEEFANYKKIALELGFTNVASGPFVRSSYNAKEMLGSVQKCFGEKRNFA